MYFTCNVLQKVMTDRTGSVKYMTAAESIAEDSQALYSDAHVVDIAVDSETIYGKAHRHIYWQYYGTEINVIEYTKPVS